MTTAYAAKSRPDFLLSGAEQTAGTLAEGLRAPGRTIAPTGPRWPSSRR